MLPDLEIELKFLVPAQARAALAAEMARKTSSSERIRLQAIYLDTPDRRLARAGLAWRLRREGRRWVQTLKAPGATAFERFEHEVLRPGPQAEPSAHAGTAAGERLAALLAKARADGEPVQVRYRTDVRRSLRRIRTQGAVVEVAFDEGRIDAGEPGAAGASLRLCELEFELVSGKLESMLALAERWRRRFGLLVDPRTKAERGDRLADDNRFPAVRRASDVVYAREARPVEAFGTVLDECLAQVARNLIGLVVGDPQLRVEHVHQARVGIRRLRSALRAFRGIAPAAPSALVEGIKRLFDALGRSRDADVLESGVARALAEAGAPPLRPVPRLLEDVVDVAALAAAPDTQRLLFGWMDWRARLALPPTAAAAPATSASASVPASAPDAPAEPDTQASDAPVASELVPATDPAPDVTRTEGLLVQPGRADAGTPEASPSAVQVQDERPPDLPAAAARRLRRWHKAIAAASEAFEGLDEPALHALRKRIKRQRYAVEFFAPVLKRGPREAYLERLRPAQERMGELNDLFVARARYQSMADGDAGAWFALGWLAARIEPAREQARLALRRLARSESPVVR